MAGTNVVTLNVGGRVFQTTRTTLLSQSGSYFEAMLASHQWQPDAQGAYFIDLDPAHFDRILNYLRFGDLVLDGLADWDTVLVIRMMQYLNLEPPPSLGLLWDPSLRGQIALSNQCRTITAPASFKQFAALGLQPTHEFSLHIDAMTFDLDKPSFRVGFANREGFDPDETTDSEWLIDVRLSGPEHFTTLAAPPRPKNAVMANVGDIVTVRFDAEASRLQVHKHGDARNTVHVRMTPSTDENGPYPCVVLRAAQSTDFNTSIREWVASQVTLVETPPQ